MMLSGKSREIALLPPVYVHKMQHLTHSINNGRAHP